MTKIKITAIEHDYIYTYAICEVIEGSCTWDEVYHIHNRKGIWTSNLNFSMLEIEKMDKSPEGNERRRVHIYSMDKSEYEEALEEHPDSIITPGFMLVGVDDEIMTMPEGNTDAESDISESDDILSVEQIREILDSLLTMTDNEEAIEAVNTLKNLFEDNLSLSDSEDEITKTCKTMTPFVIELYKMITNEAEQIIERLRRRATVQYNSLENNDAIKAAKTDVFGVYNMLKNGEISSDSKQEFIQATYNDSYLYSVFDHLDLTPNVDMNVLIDGLEKSLLMTYSIKGEDRQKLLGLYGNDFSNKLAHFLGAKKTLKIIDEDLSTAFAVSMVGSLNETRKLYTQRANSLPPKPESKIIKRNTIIAIITGLLTLITLNPGIEAFLTGDTGIGVLELVFSAILIMGFIKLKFKGVAIAFGGIVAWSFIIDFIVSLLNITMVPGRSTRIYILATFVLAFAVSLMTIISQKRRATTSKYKSTRNQRYSYVNDIDEIIKMITIIRDTSVASTREYDLKERYALNAYYNYCISRFRDIKNKLV